METIPNPSRILGGGGTNKLHGNAIDAVVFVHSSLSRGLRRVGPGPFGRKHRRGRPCAVGIVKESKQQRVEWCDVHMMSPLGYKCLDLNDPDVFQPWAGLLSLGYRPDVTHRSAPPPSAKRPSQCHVVLRLGTICQASVTRTTRPSSSTTPFTGSPVYPS